MAFQPLHGFFLNFAGQGASVFHKHSHQIPVHISGILHFLSEFKILLHLCTYMFI